MLRKTILQDKEQLTRENIAMQKNVKDMGKSVTDQKAVKLVRDAQRNIPAEKTQILPVAKQFELSPVSPWSPSETSQVDLQSGAQPREFLSVGETQTSLPISPAVYTKTNFSGSSAPVKFKKQDATDARMLQERCRQLCLTIFSQEHAPVRSLGFTSSIEEEGKSFLAFVTGQVLAHDSTCPVTLLDCNWEHPSLHEYFGIPAIPGLAEWLRGMCAEKDIRYQVKDNLFVIPAGNGSQDAAKLLRLIQRHGLLNMFRHSNELFIVDLPPIIATAYGPLAASLLESVVVVVRAQAVPDTMIVETCSRLKDIPVHGIILNQEQSRIPRWLRKLL